MWNIFNSLHFGFRDSKSMLTWNSFEQSKCVISKSYWRKCNKITFKNGFTNLSKESVFLFNIFPHWRILFLQEAQNVHLNFHLWKSSKAKVRTTSFCIIILWQLSDLYLWLQFCLLQYANVSEVRDSAFTQFSCFHGLKSNYSYYFNAVSFSLIVYWKSATHN